MRADCRKRMTPILGRPMMREEEAAIDRRMRRAVKELKRTDPTWGELNKAQRLNKAAELAGTSFEQELSQYRMEVPPKAPPLPEDVRQAERDRQQRAEDQGFTIKAVRGVRLVHGESNPVDAYLTGGRWFTDRPETANTYSGQFGGGMATASMKVRLRLRNPLVIDAKSKRFDGIPREWLPEDVKKEAIRGKLLSTDEIADAARFAAGKYDGVIFKNLKDDLTSNAITTKPATVYVVFDRKNIRSEFAQFDPEWSEDPGLLFQGAADLQKQPLKINGSGPGGRVLNRDLAKALTDRHMETYGRALDPSNPEDYQVIIDSAFEDFKEQSEQPDTGDAWYTDDINTAIELTSEIYPELRESATFRDLFLTVTALLSPQQKPAQNWENAVLALRSWTKSGKIELQKPTGKQFGVRSHTTGLQMLQYLIDTHGLEQALVWVQTEHTGRELAEMRMASGLFSPIDKATGEVSTKVKDYLPSETNLTERKLGIYAFGPKVGDFMQNSVGIDQNAVTVDLWLARTYNRYIGRLLDVSPKQAEAGAIASELRGRAEREHIKRLVRDVAEQSGIDPSAMQAALWYFEQRLYRAHGIKSDSQNFSDAARKALETRGIDVGRQEATVLYQPITGPDASQGQVDGASRQVNRDRLSRPVELADGTVELVHYGRVEGLTRTDPKQWGSAGAFLTRQERNRIGDAPWRTYFGGNVGLAGGYQKESGTGDYVYYAYVPINRLYDLAADPDNLLEAGQAIAADRKVDILTGIELSVQEAGYSGYWRAHPGLGMTAVVFDEVEISSERRSDAAERYQRAGNRGGRDQGGAIAPLEGAPSIRGATGPDPSIVAVAEQYAASKGIDLRRQAEYASVDEERAARIAAAYDAMEHAPQDPQVRAAYADLIQQTIDQYQALVDAGYKFWFYDETNDPYEGNPWNAMRDLRANKQMGVFASEVGFGSGATDLNVDDNPLLADTGIEWPYGVLDGPKKRVLANDLFRAVHDAFGHGMEGAGFRARGEENAWQAHVRLFTGSAVAAITTETRGQNSWLNYGPYGEANRTAKVEDTVFADQKTGLLPEWTWTEGRVGDVRQDALEKGFPLFATRGDPKGWGETTPPPDLPPMRLNLAYTRDAYGDEAVRRLPAPIRERAASGSSIDSMLDVIRGVKKTLKRKPPKTLTQWINAKRRGYGKSTVSSPTAKGINGIKGAADELRAMGLEKLINEKSGTDLDYVREAAIEDGFLPEGATVNDLLAAMDAESRGEPTYSRFDEAGVLDLQAAEAWEKMFDDAGINIFEDSDKDLRKKLSDFVSSQNDDAVTPDQAAEKFGFGSGEELLNALANIGNRERYIAEQVRREMQQEFGDPFNDGTLTEKARVMAESELRARAGEIELEALARAVGEVAASRMAKEMARDTLQMLTVKELAQWRRYQQAERREMENAMEAIKRGDAVQAFIHKRRQMVNMHLAREGEKLFEQIEKTRKHLLTYENSKTKRERLVKAGQSYVDQMDDLLDRYRLRKEGPKARRAAESLHAWATQQLVEMDPLKHLKPFKDNENIDSEESEADPLAGLADIGPDEQIQAEQDLEKFRALKRAKEEASGIPYTALTAEDFFAIRQQADHIYHLAKLKTSLLADQKKRSFLQVVSEVTESILSNKARDAAQDPLETDIPKEKRKRQFRHYMAAHRTLLSLARQMDGGKDGGPVQMLLVYPLSKAFADRAAVWREMEQGIQEMFSMYSNAEKRAMFQRSVNIPAINQTMTKQGVLAVALNMGTEKNRQRMMDSEGWSLEQLYAIVESLDQRDWRFVQGVWEYLGSWFPKADEVHKRVHGVGMDKVEPVEVITKFGVLKGGYYPIVFDPVRSSKTMQRQLESEARAQAGRVGARSQAGFTKRRAEGKVTIPVRYSVLDVILGHLSDVADSITVQEPLMDVGRIVVHPDFEAAVKQKYGSGIYRQIILALRESKQGQEVAKDETEKALVHLRNGQTIVGLGLRFSTAALQVFGLSNSAVRIGSYWLYKGILRNGMSAFEREQASSFVAERSSMMVNRRNAMTREISDLRNNFKGDRTPGWVKESYFWMITVMQYHLVDMPTWLGQYEKAIVNGFEESDAIAQADLAVQEAQGTGEIYGLAGIQRGSPLLKIFTNFLSYMITTANLATERTAATNFRNAAQVANWALDMTMLMIFPVVTKMMLDAILKGVGPDEDDDETWLGLYAKEQASFLMSMNFFPAQVAGALGGYSYDGPTGTAALKEIQTSLSRVTDGDGDVIEAWRPALAAAGAIFHLPTGQIDTSIRGIQGLASGESEDYSDIVFGPSPETREAMRN